MNEKTKIVITTEMKAEMYREVRGMWSFLSFQGNRVINAYNYSKGKDLFDDNLITITEKEYRKRVAFTDFVKQEAEVFSLLFYRLICCLNSWGKYCPVLKPYGKDLRKTFHVSDAADVRDMCAHIDEYLSGKGKNRDNYEVVFEGKVTNAFSIDVTNNTLVIGGRLNVHDIVNKLNEVWHNFEKDINISLRELV